MSLIAEDVVRAARGWIGTPYMHQHSLKGAGTDCLGLLRGVWREVIGTEPVVVPAYSDDWSEISGREDLMQAGRAWLRQKALEDAAPGDVLLFRMQEGCVAKHLGIAAVVAPVPSFVHVYSGHAVVESPLSRPWARRIVARFSFPERS